MFLIFHLQHPNVLPKSDVGLLKSISKNYNKGSWPVEPALLKRLEKKWHPWCTVATWFMWRDLDPVEVNY